MFIKTLSPERIERLRTRFNRLYGQQQAELCIKRLVAMTGRYGIGYEDRRTTERWNEKTAVLITYADTLHRDGEPPLATLNQFSEKYFSDLFSTIHLLPFFPWSSDDGFSVIDYRQVNPACGRWRHIEELGNHFNLMFDLVLNHVSRKSTWFKHYIANIAPYRDYFIEVNPATDLSAVVRPRNLPLLTPVRWNGKEKYLWTTFSDDQIDLNFACPDVLFEFLDILLFYIANGATIIRLDAIAYLWKQPGTACIHLEQTHEIVKLMRDLLDMIAPEVILLTETNVPHDENISYFGQGDEARMVYQFSLPPLLLHALQTGNTTFLTDWARSVSKTPDGCTWFNFTASHDGIGVRPLTGLIPENEYTALIEKIKTLGGQVSVKRNPDGTESPYELNITYFDALGGDEHQVARFLCSQTIMLSLKGIPGIYIHSLTATPNDQEGVRKTGKARSINRKKWNVDELDKLLDKDNTSAQVFAEYRRRLKIRRTQTAFHPEATQRIINLGTDYFAFARTGLDGNCILCISNFSEKQKSVQLDESHSGLTSSAPCTDLLSGARISGTNKTLTLDAYQTVWLANY